MKKLLLITISIFLFSSIANASLLFSEDFSGSNLDSWYTIFGETVADPTDATNNVLGFSNQNSWGDAFSPLIDNSVSSYWISFDYYSTDTTSANGGGFFGIDEDGYKPLDTDGGVAGPNGPHTWLIGTPAYSNIEYLPQSNSTWQHIVSSFNAPEWSQFSLMFEDFRAPGGDAYFDNINLYDSNPVPEPATFILLGSGLAGLAFYRRKKK
jgi:hypothetical protein